MDILNGQLGPEVKYDISFSGGALVISAGYQGQQAGFSLSGSVSAAQLIAALQAKVSSPVEKEILSVVGAIISGIS